MAVTTTTSSTLLAKLEHVNWSYSINTTLLGVDTNLLVKYIVEDNAYAIMVTDFSSTYFECLIGNKIEENFNRYNNKSKRLSCPQILELLAEMLKDLKATSNLSFEKVEIPDCHTVRINVKASKMFTKQKFDWRFYIISTDPQIFLKHFSLPVWRGLMHYYHLSQDSFLDDQMIKQENNSHNNHVDENNIATVPVMIEDSKLKDVFR